MEKVEYDLIIHEIIFSEDHHHCNPSFWQLSPWRRSAVASPETVRICVITYGTLCIKIFVILVDKFSGAILKDIAEPRKFSCVFLFLAYLSFDCGLTPLLHCPIASTIIYNTKQSVNGKCIIYLFSSIMEIENKLN